MGKQLESVEDSKSLDDFVNQLNQLPESYIHHDFPLKSYMQIYSEIYDTKSKYFRYNFSYEGEVTIKQGNGLYVFRSGNQFQHFTKPNTWTRVNHKIVGEEIIKGVVIRTEITLYKEM